MRRQWLPRMFSMAYDYSSDNQRLELPNPYRVQNLFLFLSAAVLLVGALLALWWAREALQGQALARFVAPMLAGVALLVAALLLAVTAARRLRFFFGRGRPASLAPELAPGALGGSQDATALKETLRQGALIYPEPKGALNGMLYHATPNLISAPQLVRSLMERHFFNALAFAVTALSFAVAWGLFGTPATRPLIGIFYALFAAVLLLRPLLMHDQARMGTAALVVLVVVALIGPVAAGMLGPRLPSMRFAVHAQAMFLLAAALVAVLLVLAALRAQLAGMPTTQRSCEQSTVAFNGPPAALVTELDRHLQDQWSEKIPNRRYARNEPEVSAVQGSGRFEGEVVEESQPLPLPASVPSGLGQALASPRHRWLVMLDAFGTALTVAAVVMVLMYVRALDPARMADGGLVNHALLGHALIALAVAAFAFRSASAVWGRFDFESHLVWVELAGTWQASRVGTGNTLSSHLQTDNQVVRVDAMTLRVWRARIESVVFGKDGERQVMAMFSTQEQAQRLSRHLAEFAAAQTVFIAPGAQEDQRRIRNLQAANAALGGAQPTAQAFADGRPMAGLAQRFCATCGAAATAEARFCARCGTGLLATTPAE